VIPIEQRFFALAQRHLDSPDRDVRRLANALFLMSQPISPFSLPEISF
jgi:hypothetical protein